MTIRLRLAALLAFTVAAVLLGLLAAQPASAKVGPVCTVKQAKAHPHKCVVILMPKGTKGQVVVVTPAPAPKA